MKSQPEGSPIWSEPNGKEITSMMYYPPAYGESDEELDEETIAEK
jgi:hypothetical protein